MLSQAMRMRDARAQRGFTLLELIISVTLGLVVMLSGAYLATQFLHAAALNAEATDLGDNKQVVDENMETDFKQGGNYLFNVTPAAATATSYTAEVAADTPRIWWRLDDAANSTTAFDNSGNDLTGTVTGQATY